MFIVRLTDKELEVTRRALRVFAPKVEGRASALEATRSALAKVKAATEEVFPVDVAGHDDGFEFRARVDLGIDPADYVREDYVREEVRDAVRNLYADAFDLLSLTVALPGELPE